MTCGESEYVPQIFTYATLSDFFITFPFAQVTISPAQVPSSSPSTKYGASSICSSNFSTFSTREAKPLDSPSRPRCVKISLARDSIASSECVRSYSACCAASSSACRWASSSIAMVSTESTTSVLSASTTDLLLSWLEQYASRMMRSGTKIRIPINHHTCLSPPSSSSSMYSTGGQESFVGGGVAVDCMNNG